MLVLFAFSRKISLELLDLTKYFFLVWSRKKVLPTMSNDSITDEEFISTGIDDIVEGEKR